MKKLIIFILLLLSVSVFADTTKIEKRIEEIPSGFKSGEYGDAWVINAPTGSYRHTIYTDVKKLDGCLYKDEIGTSQFYPIPNIVVGWYRCPTAQALILEADPTLFIFWDEVEMMASEYCVEATRSDVVCTGNPPECIGGELISEVRIPCP